MLIKHYLALFFLLFLSTSIFAQKKFTLSGTIRDAGTGETLIGATIRITGASTAATLTNNYGYFALTQAEGTYTVAVSYTGYASVVKTINLTKDTKLNEELKSANELAEVTVSANNRKNENV